METVFEIVERRGLGVVECINEDYSTGLIFETKESADKKADELWKEKTTEKDRNSGWCGLHYIVKERGLNK